MLRDWRRPGKTVLEGTARRVGMRSLFWFEGVVGMNWLRAMRVAWRATEVF
jgi:hypothetical protein